MSLFEFPEQIHIYECKWSVFDLTLPKLLFAVLLGDFHLEYLVFTDRGGHFRQALSARAPNSNQKHVAPGLSDHTYCTGYWGGNTKTSCKFFIYKILVMACGLCFLLLFWYFVPASAYGGRTLLPWMWHFLLPLPVCNLFQYWHRLW